MRKLQIIRTLLDKSTYKKGELSEHLGVARNNFYLWRDGKTIPKQSTINKLAKLMGYQIIWRNEKNGTLKKILSENRSARKQNTIDLNYVVELQKQVIENLQDEVSNLKDEIRDLKIQQT